MRAILLAAGRGERLRPYTDETPKCLLPVGGKPLLAYWLEACERHGFDEVLVNLYWLADQVEAFLEPWKRRLDLKLIRETSLLGTAGTLRANWDFVASESLFLMAHADNFTDLNLGKFRDAFLRGKRDLTVLGTALFRTPTPSTCGVVRLDDTGHVIEFHEKVPDPPGNLANGAVYLGTPSLGSHLRLDEPGLFPLDFSTEVIPQLMGRILGWEFPGFLVDIGSPEQYERVRARATEFQTETGLSRSSQQR